MLRPFSSSLIHHPLSPPTVDFLLGSQCLSLQMWPYDCAVFSSHLCDYQKALRSAFKAIKVLSSDTSPNIFVFTIILPYITITIIYYLPE